MLVLSRAKGEKIIISDNIEITIVEIRGRQVRIGITAPLSVTILREELVGGEKKHGTDAKDSKANA